MLEPNAHNMKNTFHWIFVVVIIAFTAVSCKKDKYASFEVTLSSDKVVAKKATVRIKEVWLNYATKKSNSEWMKLEVDTVSYDLARLYNGQVDTLFIPEVKVDNITTLMKFRVVVAADKHSVITPADDTLEMTLDPTLTDGIKASVNKSLENLKTYTVQLKFQPDTVAMSSSTPVFKSSIALKGFGIKGNI